jgi:diguanylate cyclase (GGDEF)-like protein
MPLTTRARTRLLLVIAVMVIAGTVWVAGSLKGRALDRGFQQNLASERMLEAMLDQETGLRGYLLTGDDRFLEPYRSGVSKFAAAVRAAKSSVIRDRATALDLIAQQGGISQRWRALAEARIAFVRAHGVPKHTQVGPALRRKALMDRFRVVNHNFQSHVSAWNADERRDATRLSAEVVLVVSILFFGLGYLIIERGARVSRRRRERQRRYETTQAEFAETLQIAQDETEANGLLKVHLERSIPGSTALVLNRNNSAARLEPATPLPDDSPLKEPLKAAVPRSCFAVRLGGVHHRTRDAVPLMTCAVCGQLPGASTCSPLLVSGEVIGSVLVEHPDQPDDERDRRMQESVRLAAPVLANLRNLAIAEQRAATDSLTGLPNKRSLDDTYRRMVAQASRTASPLAVMIMDLDHFKQINDTYGHGHGDDVLAAIAATMTDTLRASDFVGRYGGEEFLILLPATDLEGGLRAAEKLRRAIATLEVPGVHRDLTASFGLAVLPDHALDGEQLVRLADRALYAAKRAGRNRVAVAEPTPREDVGAEPESPAASGNGQPALDSVSQR